MFSRVWTGVTIACLLLLCLTPWIRLNVSPSVPCGLYRLHQVPAVLMQGDLVVLPTPVVIRPWHSRWIPLLKPVAAIAGDTVCMDDAELWIQGESYGVTWLGDHEHPLPHIEGCHVIDEGQVFLASHTLRSLDSRYFGPVSTTDIAAVATPLVTWGACDGW